MSGLFRRLAERACGQRQPLLHARVLPAFLADAEESQIEASPLPLATPLPLPPLTLETAVAPALSQPAAEPSVIHREQPLAVPPVAAPQTQAPAPRPVPMAPNTPADLPMVHTPPQVARPGTEPNPAIERAPLPSRQPAAEQSSLQPDTSLLMPTTPRTAPSRPALTAFNPPPTAAPPDEIHVHIGRIEVTAVRESAPTKPSARTPQPTLSLDAYLAKRKGQPSRGEPS
jgi:hypothetical protein